MKGSLWTRKIPAATKTIKATHMRRRWELFCKLLTQNNSLFVISFGEWRVFRAGCFPPGNELSLVGIISQQFFFPFSMLLYPYGCSVCLIIPLRILTDRGQKQLPLSTHSLSRTKILWMTKPEWRWFGKCTYLSKILFARSNLCIVVQKESKITLRHNGFRIYDCFYSNAGNCRMKTM